MAILTQAQKEANATREKENRTYVRKVYAVSPASDKAKAGTALANHFYFGDNAYPMLDMVAVDRRFNFEVRGDKVAPEKKNTVVYTDLDVEDVAEYQNICNEFGKDEIAINYETLVYMPALDAFANFATKGYSREINTAVENAGYRVIAVTPNIHVPEKSKKRYMLYLYEVSIRDEEIDPTGHEDYESELSKFRS